MSSESSYNLPPGTVVFGPEGNCNLDICPVELSVYQYRPSLAANGTFIALYALALLIHTYLGFRWKQWFYTGAMIVGCINAIIGYTGRIMLYYNPFSFTAFMIQIICVTSGPVYFTAAIYVTLAVAVRFFAPELSRFRPSLFYWMFIPADVASLVLQAAGGALSTSSSGSSKVGVDLAIAGMAFQVFILLVFIALSADYLIRYFRSNNAALETRTKLFFGFMGVAIVLILARCIYRLVELNEGYSGPLVANEALFIGLEGVMVIISVYCLMIAHPGFGLRKESRPGKMSIDSSVEMVRA